MDVEDAVRERGEELRLHDAHEPREDDGVDSGLLQQLDAAVFRGALELRLPRRAVEVLARDAVALRAVEYLRVLNVRKDKLYLRVEGSGPDRVHYRLHVRARAGPENSEM